jgi:hypothetical protein
MTHSPSIVWTSLCGAALALLAMGCDCAGPTGVGVCDAASHPIACGRACGPTAPCPGGFFCSAGGTCDAECSMTVACAGGGTCTSDGHCRGGTVDSGREAGPPVDAPGADTTCAAVSVGTTLATPNVILIVDQSGSMGDHEFPAGSGTSRWEAVDAALLDNPGGLVHMLQSNVRFGLALYHEQSTACPDLTLVPAELMNFTPIQTRFDAESPGGGTPTGQSIEELLTRIDEVVTHPEEPTIFVLATDGEPDTCEDGNDEVRGRALSVAAVGHAFDAGIETFVISVGVDVSNAHLQDLANAGVNSPAGTDAPFYVATDTAALSTALTTIVGGVVSCNLTLHGMIDPTAACLGEVQLGGRVLTCDDPNGWHAVDATHIEITGTACDELLGGAELTAAFPCGVLVI